MTRRFLPAIRTRKPLKAKRVTVNTEPGEKHIPLPRGATMDTWRYWLSAPVERIFADFKADPDGYIHVDRGSKILAVAHLDTVQDVDVVPPKKSKDAWTLEARGLDDRLGAAAIWLELPKMGVEVDVLFTNYEETGHSTAALFPDADKYNWIVEFDRAGEDVVTYGMDSPEWLAALEWACFQKAHGSFSDIKAMDTELCAVNIGIGYQRSHAADSYANLRAMKRQLLRFKDLYEKYRDTRFVAEKPKYAAYTGFGWRGQSAWDWDGDVYTAKAKKRATTTKQYIAVKTRLIHNKEVDTVVLAAPVPKTWKQGELVWVTWDGDTHSYFIRYLFEGNCLTLAPVYGNPPAIPAGALVTSRYPSAEIVAATKAGNTEDSTPAPLVVSIDNRGVVKGIGISLTEFAGYAIIDNVKKDSVAEAAGVLQDDVLLAVGGHTIHSIADVRKALEGTYTKLRAFVRLRREGATIMRTLRYPARSMEAK